MNVEQGENRPDIGKYGNFGNELRILRERLGFSQAVFAKVLNQGENPRIIHQASLSRIESGQQGAIMDPRFYSRLATIDGVEFSDLQTLLLRGLDRPVPRILMGPAPRITIGIDISAPFSDAETNLLRSLVEVTVEDFMRGRNRPSGIRT